jgi:hypothetical protein
MPDMPKWKHGAKAGRYLLLTDTINHILFFLAIKMGGGEHEDITGMPMPLAIYVVKT